MRIKNSTFLAITALAAGSFLMVACSKDNYTTKPQLKFKSISGYNLKQGDLLKFELEVTDSEGDIQNEIAILRTIKHNPTLSDTSRYPISSDIPSSKDLKAAINICFVLNRVGEQCPIFTGPKTAIRSDTTTFKFWIKDKAGNVSDTISVDKEVIIEN